MFTPSTVTAKNGDVVTFVFSGHRAGMHSVVQSTFAHPCEQADGGFNSGFLNVTADQTDNFPIWNLTITDANTSTSF